MNEQNIKKRILEAAQRDVPDLTNQILAQARRPLEKRSFLSYFRRHTTQFASLLLIALIGGFLLMNMVDNSSTDTVTADSTIYMDINPSFEIDIDDEDNIIDFRALNADAEHIKSLLNAYQNKNIYTVIDDIIDHAINENYLSEDNPYVMIDVKGQSETRQAALLESIETRIPEHAQARMSNISMIRGNAQNPTDDEIDDARDHHLSMMQLRTIEAILELTDDYTFEDLETESTGELIKIYQSLSDDDSNRVPPHRGPNTTPR